MVAEPQYLQAAYDFHAPRKVEGIWELSKSKLSYNEISNPIKTIDAEFSLDGESISSFAVVHHSSPKTVVFFNTYGKAGIIQQSEDGVWSQKVTSPKVKAGWFSQQI